MTARRLLLHTELEVSPVVANNVMNRERGLTGSTVGPVVGYRPRS